VSPAGRPSSVPDGLGDEVARITEWLAEHELKCVSAWVKTGPATVTVHWGGQSDEDVPDWKTFLAQAKAMNAPFVALQVHRLTEEDWESERESASDRNGDSIDSQDLRDLFDQTRSHVGSVGFFELQWIAPAHNGVVFSLEMSADWWDEFYAQESTETEAGAGARELSPSELKKLGREIAHSAEYELASDYGERQEVVREKLASDYSDVEDDFHNVSSAAAAIFEKEVLPKLKKSPEVTELSLKLANDQRFQRASNQQARLYAAEQILPAEVLSHRTKLKLILDKARTIYDVDLRKGNRVRH
jgi:hypothetical protein